jgi:hypothetical protein
MLTVAKVRRNAAAFTIEHLLVGYSTLSLWERVG